MQLIAEQLRNGQIDLSESLRRMGDEYRGEMADFFHRCSLQAEFYEGEVERMGEEITGLESEVDNLPSQSSYDRMEDNYNDAIEELERIQGKNLILQSRVSELEDELNELLK